MAERTHTLVRGNTLLNKETALHWRRMLAIEKQSRNWDGGHRDWAEVKILSRG